MESNPSPTKGPIDSISPHETNPEQILQINAPFSESEQENVKQSEGFP